ncbi:uncharacterized protein O3C94_015588 [Discoglossus pictus]
MEPAINNSDDSDDVVLAPAIITTTTAICYKPITAMMFGRFLVSSYNALLQCRHKMMSKTETPGRASSLRGCILTVFLSVWMDLTSGIDIQLIPQYPKVGQMVTLSVNGVTGSLLIVTWYKGGRTDFDTIIFNYIFTNTPIQTKGQQYFSRAKALTNGSLQISELSKEDEGNYTVQIQTETAQQAMVYLPVYDDWSSIDVPPETNAPSTTDFSCSAATAAIVCGAILAIFLIISFLLYKRYILPVRRGHRGPPTEGKTSDTVYENALGNTMGNAVTDESSYAGLKFQSQDTYSELHR